MNPLEIGIQFGALLVAVICHEVAHGVVAGWFGDPTARDAGRLTLNPIPHIDPLGSIILPLLFFISGSHFMIGWAKPVPVDPRYFKRPTRDMMWVAVAGPLTNFTLAVMASIVLRVLGAAAVWPVLVYVLAVFVQINILLMVFNLLPIPPLDGSRVMMHFLPPDWRASWARLEPFGILIVFGLAYFGLLFPLIDWIYLPLVSRLLG
jgi:Zn-dependent protease